MTVIVRPDINRLVFALFVLFMLCVSACEPGRTADMIVYNGFVYTVDANYPYAEAVAIKDGLICGVGSNQDMMSLKSANTKLIDVQGAFVMPGLIEGHGHLSSFGKMLLELNLAHTESWREIVDSVAAHAMHAEPGAWIVGRGWHQEKWKDTLMANVMGYPYNQALSQVSPDNPVMLIHASGHGLIANARAMELAGVTKESMNPSGGNIVRDPNGEPIGVFEENAMTPIKEAYATYVSSLDPDDVDAYWLKGIQLAESECLKYGITSFQDAGSTIDEINSYAGLARKGQLQIRLWAMLLGDDDSLEENLSRLPVIGVGDGYFTCRAVKLWIDGALGSYGAWLLKPYEGRPGYYGQNTISIEQTRNVAKLCKEHGMQLCIHAIGDRANREVLDIYKEYSSGEDGENTDLRWRIEHAQHIAPEDMARFAEYGVVAAMQGIHCTSDAPFVINRLGEQRAREESYAWRSLLDAGAVVGNGTDVPVESIDPYACLYASITRKANEHSDAFFPEQAMTREEAIYSYTMSNAYAAFEEKHKGSLVVGKYADITIVSENLLNCEAKAIPNTRALMTIIGGQILYQAPNFTY